MKKSLFIFLVIACTHVNACPSLADMQTLFSLGDIPSIKESESCGFDLHLEGDKALHIASKNNRRDIEEYLRSRGLKYNAKFIRTVWLADYFSMSSLMSLSSLYELDTYKKLDEATWYDVLRKYIESKGNDRQRLTDIWGNKYIYKGKGDSYLIPHIFCTLGRDGKPGGELYDKDICTNDDLNNLEVELKNIGYF